MGILGALGRPSTPTHESRYLQTGALLVLGATLGFALKGVFARVAFARGLPSEHILLMRMLLAAPLFALALLWSRRRTHSIAIAPADWLRAAAVGSLFITSGALDFFAIERIGAGPSRVILFSHPALILAYQALRTRRPPTRRESLAFAGAWLGLWLAAGLGPGSEHAQLDPLGIALACGSAVGYAAYLLATQGLMRRMGSTAFICTANLSGAVFVLVIEGSLGMLPKQGIPDAAWPAILGIVFVSTVLPQLAFTEGLHRLGAAKASLLSLIGPPATIAAAALWVGESMNLTQLAGCALVIGSIARLKGAKPAVRDTTPKIHSHLPSPPWWFSLLPSASLVHRRSVRYRARSGDKAHGPRRARRLSSQHRERSPRPHHRRRFRQRRIDPATPGPCRHRV